jgi:hypothetical protein
MNCYGHSLHDAKASPGKYENVLFSKQKTQKDTELYVTDDE